MGSRLIAESDNVTVLAEVLDTGDGTATSFSGTSAKNVVAPGSLTVTDGTETFTDDGKGVLTGSAGGSGTINYQTGAVAVTFNAAPANLTDITMDYIAIEGEGQVTNASTPATLSFRADDKDVMLWIGVSEDGENYIQWVTQVVPAWAVASIGNIPQSFMDVRTAGGPGRLFGGPINVL